MQGRRRKKCKNDAAKQQHPQAPSPLFCLGIDVVNNVVTQLAHTLEPGGVRGPSLVARDLAAAAQVCKEFRTAAQRGFEQLAELVYSQLYQQLGMPTCLNETQQALFMELHDTRTQHPALYLLPPTSACGPISIVALALAFVVNRSISSSNISAARDRMREDSSKLKQAWAFWDAITSSPANISYEQLTEAALKLGLPLHHSSLYHPVSQESASLTHAELRQSVLALFGLSAGTRVPAVVLAAVARERLSGELVCDGEDACTHVHFLLKDLAVLARDAYIPLGLKAQGWGYGQRRPPGWPRRTQVPEHQKGIAVRVKGGMAAVRAALAAAGIDNLRQLEKFVTTERHKVAQLTANLSARLGHTSDESAAAATGRQRHKILQKQKLISAVWKTEKKAARQQQLAGQMGKFGQVLCSCGEVAAKHCVRGSCAKCCVTAAIAAAVAAPPPAAAAAAVGSSSTGGSSAQQHQQVACLRHKVCKGCGGMEAAKHCVRGCCAHCCGRSAAAEGAVGPCIKH